MVNWYYIKIIELNKIYNNWNFASLVKNYYKAFACKHLYNFINNIK